MYGTIRLSVCDFAYDRTYNRLDVRNRTVGPKPYKEVMCSCHNGLDGGIINFFDGVLWGSYGWVIALSRMGRGFIKITVRVVLQPANTTLHSYVDRFCSCIHINASRGDCSPTGGYFF